jgi:hypothetical protein
VGVTEPTQCGGSACGAIDRARQQRRSLGTVEELTDGFTFSPFN